MPSMISRMLLPQGPVPGGPASVAAPSCSAPLRRSSSSQGSSAAALKPSEAQQKALTPCQRPSANQLASARHSLHTVTWPQRCHTARKALSHLERHAEREKASLLRALRAQESGSQVQESTSAEPSGPQGSPPGAPAAMSQAANRCPRLAPTA